MRLSLGDLPDSSFAWGPGRGLAVRDFVVDNSHVSGLWRRPGWPDFAAYHPKFHSFIERECRDAFQGAIEAIGIRWLTAPEVLARAELKLVQLQQARELGIPHPDSLVTNDPHEALAFKEAHERVVVKPVRYGLVTSEERPFVAWTTEATHKDLHQLDGPPVIVQALIEAKEHFRAVTVGSRVFLSSLQTDAIDWRTKTANHDRFDAVPAQDQPTVAKGALLLSEALGLGFSAQDWVVDKDDAPYFIEANPNGQWAFLEPAQDGAIGRAIAAELEDMAAQGCVLQDG